MGHFELITKPQQKYFKYMYKKNFLDAEIPQQTRIMKLYIHLVKPNK